MQQAMMPMLGNGMGGGIMMPFMPAVMQQLQVRSFPLPFTVQLEFLESEYDDDDDADDRFHRLHEADESDDAHQRRFWSKRLIARVLIYCTSSLSKLSFTFICKFLSVARKSSFVSSYNVSV